MDAHLTSRDHSAARRITRRPVMAAIAAACLILAACGDATEDFPSQSIDLVVPFAAGGGTDQIARALAQEAEETCDTSISIINEEGASGTVGLNRVLNAQPDGYTLAVGTTSTLLATHHGVSDTTPDDMTPLLQFNFDSSVLSVAADSPYETIQDFLDGADADDLTVGTSGTGSIWELSYMGMADAAGVTSPTNVPYDGAAPAIVGVLGGEADATSVSGVEALAQIESGELRPLAAMSPERLPFLPDVPTLEEEGVDWESGVWRGLVGPADMEPEVTDYLINCFDEAAEAADYTDYMDTQGYERRMLLGDDFAQMLDEEFETYGQMVEDLG